MFSSGAPRSDDRRSLYALGRDGRAGGVAMWRGALAAASALVLLACAAAVGGRPAPARPPAPIIRLSAIDRVWSGHSVGFALAVTADRIVVGYYDAARQLTVASRPRTRDAWVYHKLDSWVGWDSHNSVALAVDDAGQIHVAANMHGDPLVYYRTTAAGDLRTLARQASMADPARERRMTYPVFLKDAAGRLIFKYRDGSSGNGDEIYDIYDSVAARWTRLTSTPLTDGEGQRNAYFVGPVAGSDGRFHIAWVWRDSPDAATNHSLSYARSRDLIRWEGSDGRTLRLPIRLATAEIVDPVLARGGIINNNTQVGFDAAGTPVIAYHKFDAAGDTQVYVARRDNGRWHIARASDWHGFRWDFGGGGSLDFRLVVKAPVADGADRIRVPVVRDGRAIDLILDRRTLAMVEERAGSTLAARLPAAPAGMTVETVEDTASGIAIAWSARPARRYRASADIPDPTTLRLVETAQR